MVDIIGRESEAWEFVAGGLVKANTERELDRSSGSYGTSVRDRCGSFVQFTEIPIRNDQVSREPISCATGWSPHQVSNVSLQAPLAFTLTFARSCNLELSRARASLNAADRFSDVTKRA